MDVSRNLFIGTEFVFAAVGVGSRGLVTLCISLFFMSIFWTESKSPVGLGLVGVVVIGGGTEDIVGGEDEDGDGDEDEDKDETMNKVTGCKVSLLMRKEGIRQLSGLWKLYFSN